MHGMVSGCAEGVARRSRLDHITTCMTHCRSQPGLVFTCNRLADMGSQRVGAVYAVNRLVCFCAVYEVPWSKQGLEKI